MKVAYCFLLLDDPVFSAVWRKWLGDDTLVKVNARESSQFVSLTRNDALRCLVRGVGGFENCQVPADEHYSAMVLPTFGSQLQKGPLTYARFQPYHSHPDEIVELPYEPADRLGFFFIRKVTKNTKMTSGYLEWILGDKS